MRSKIWFLVVVAACATSPSRTPVPPPVHCAPRRYLLEFTIPDPSGVIYGHDPIPEDGGAPEAAPVSNHTPTVTIEELTGED